MISLLLSDKQKSWPEKYFSEFSSCTFVITTESFFSFLFGFFLPLLIGCDGVSCVDLLNVSLVRANLSTYTHLHTQGFAMELYQQ